MPFDTSLGSALTTPVLKSKNNPKPENAKENKPKQLSVTIEEVMDEDKIEYLVRNAKNKKPSKVLSHEPSVKPRASSHEPLVKPKDNDHESLKHRSSLA